MIFNSFEFIFLFLPITIIGYFTLNKFNYNSPWFRRYMCGKNGTTDEEVTEYIKKITAKC